MLGDEAKHEAVLAAVRAAFKPEFLNRLDEVVVFDALTTEELGQHRRAAGRRAWPGAWPTAGSPWRSPTAAREWLAVTGYDPAYGARPLRRLVQREIGDRLAKALLAGEVRDGDTVTVDRDGEANALALRPVETERL